MYRLSARGELVPELGSVNGVPGRGLGQAVMDYQTGSEAVGSTGFDWGGLVNTIGQVVNVGGTLYDRYVTHDTQNAALELAKLQATSEADRLRAAQLQAQTAAMAAAGGARAAPSPGILGAGLGVGTLALLAGAGVLAFVLLRKRR